VTGVQTCALPISTSNDATVDDSGNPFEEQPLVPFVIENVPNITILPRDFTAAREALRTSILPRTMMNCFANTLPESVEKDLPDQGDCALDVQRNKLREYSESTIFAEKKTDADIFPTRALENLVNRHRLKLPTVTLLGEKGAGKSYTFMSLVLSGTWRCFAERVYDDANVQTDAQILPVTTPLDLSDDARAMIRKSTSKVADTVMGGAPLSDLELTDVIDKQRDSEGKESLSSW